jgi:RNA polymerase sigma factor (sigma-70 family)
MRSDNQQNRFYELLEPELVRFQGFCHKLVRNPDLADDLAQDALYDAWKGFDKLRETPAFKTWLYQIVINRYRTSLRRFKRHTEADVALKGDIADHSEVHLRAVRERLDVSMSTLSAKERALVTLHELEGWSYEELAPMFGSSAGALRTRLTRCRQKMRETLLRYLESTNKGSITVGGQITCVAAKQDKD